MANFPFLTLHQIWVIFSHKVGYVSGSVLLKDDSQLDLDQVTRIVFLLLIHRYVVLIAHTKCDSTEDYIEKTGSCVSGSLSTNQLMRE